MLPVDTYFTGSTILTDESLFAEFVAGNQSAFAQLWQRYEKNVRIFLRRKYFPRDSNGLDDAVQATALRLIEKQVHFDPRAKVQPWLFTLAANVAIDLLDTRGHLAC
jgi:RNA polymerase sigma factor (sigma-70 family)